MKKIFVRFKNGSDARYEQVTRFGFDDRCGFIAIELSNGVHISINKDEVLFTEEYTEPEEEPTEDFMNEPVEE
jgi:hypothetical protein